MPSDDPNHFHPDYFGKGYRWHDPQVDKMIEAYSEAKRVTEGAGLTIYNATVGGKLEVFPRREYPSLFQDQSNPGVKSPLPRTLLLDFTMIGQGTATGELKAKYFAAWQPERLFHVFGQGIRNNLGISHPYHADAGYFTPAATLKAIKVFDPEVIIYRPVDDHPILHQLAIKIISELGKPYVIWMMDDWPARLDDHNPKHAAQITVDLRSLCQAANKCLAISEPMAGTFGARYGAIFDVFHNGIDTSEWRAFSRKKTAKNSALKLRYAGALANDMTCQSITDIAQAVEALGQAGRKITFEILTSDDWAPALKSILKDKLHVTGITNTLSNEEYRTWLLGSDALVIANNFDEASQTYLKHSFANKIPECLATGSVVFAYGPFQNATISYLLRVPGCVMVTDRDVEQLKNQLTMLLDDPHLRIRLGEQSRDYALKNLDILGFVSNFEKVIRKVSNGPFCKPRYDMKEVDLALKQRRNSPIVSNFLHYILGWKGVVGLVSVALIMGSKYLGLIAETTEARLIASAMAGAGQLILFFLIAHLAAYANSRR